MQSIWRRWWSEEYYLSHKYFPSIIPVPRKHQYLFQDLSSLLYSPHSDLKGMRLVFNKKLHFKKNSIILIFLKEYKRIKIYNKKIMDFFPNDIDWFHFYFRIRLLMSTWAREEINILKTIISKGNFFPHPSFVLVY